MSALALAIDLYSMFPCRFNFVYDHGIGECEQMLSRPRTLDDAAVVCIPSPYGMSLRLARRIYTQFFTAAQLDHINLAQHRAYYPHLSKCNANTLCRSMCDCWLSAGVIPPHKRQTNARQRNARHFIIATAGGKKRRTHWMIETCDVSSLTHNIQWARQNDTHSHNRLPAIIPLARPIYRITRA